MGWELKAQTYTFALFTAEFLIEGHAAIDIRDARNGAMPEPKLQDFFVYPSLP